MGESESAERREGAAESGEIRSRTEAEATDLFQQEEGNFPLGEGQTRNNGYRRYFWIAVEVSHGLLSVWNYIILISLGYRTSVELKKKKKRQGLSGNETLN